MRSRRVLALRLGVWGWGIDAKSVRSVRKRPQAFTSVRKRLQAFTKVGKRPRPKIIAKCRTVVTFGLVLRLRVSTVSTVSRIGGGPGRETQNCRHCWTCVASSRLKSVSTVSRIGGVLVAKRKTVVTFGLVLRLRVSKASQPSPGSRGGVVAKRRTVVTFGLALGLRVSKVSGIAGILVAKRRTVVTFGLVFFF